jgi:hypothetical protein
MPETPPQSPDPRKEAARQGGTWTEEEKSRGAARPGESAGAAGEAVPEGGYGGEARAATEAAAARIGDDAAGGGHAPDPDTPVGGGKGHASMGGSATEPEDGDPQAPRNPA